ncbi:heme iron utilization protein, partial [Clostridium perfringens]|nr:heme iron utilization protein [Clostridium perfringens]
MKQLDNDKIKLQYLTFVGSLKTLMLSTVDEDGMPFISYAPFARSNGKLY